MARTNLHPVRRQQVIRVLTGRYTRGQFVDFYCIAGFIPENDKTLRLTVVRMVKEGILESRKGPGGGYRLIRK